MATIIYDLWEANRQWCMLSPASVVEKLGMKILEFKTVPMADSIVMGVENIPEKLPSYITVK